MIHSACRSSSLFHAFFIAVTSTLPLSVPVSLRSFLKISGTILGLLLKIEWVIGLFFTIFYFPLLNCHTSLLTFATFVPFAKFAESVNVSNWWAQISLFSEYHILNESSSNSGLSCSMSESFVPICWFLFHLSCFFIRWFGHFLIFEAPTISAAYFHFHSIIHSFLLNSHCFIFASVTLILTFAVMFGFNGTFQNQFSFDFLSPCSIFELIFIFQHSDFQTLRVSHKHQHTPLSLFLFRFPGSRSVHCFLHIGLPSIYLSSKLLPGGF